jgi:hypothetical protein
MDGLLCYQRIGGSYATVPGCDTGGIGDVGGGDYCYYNNTQQQVSSIPTISKTTLSFATSGGLNEDEDDDTFEWKGSTVSRLNKPTVYTTHTQTNALDKDGDDDVFAWRENVEN